MDQGILDHVHRIQFATEFLAHTQPDHPADPLGIDAAQVIYGRLIALFGKSN